MLGKANRLRRSWEFGKARRRGRSYHDRLLVLHALEDHGSQVRAGFSVSKKVGKAVVRNRVKRLMREGARATLMQVKPGHDLIFTARPAAATATYGEIRQAIEELLRRGSLLTEINT